MREFLEGLETSKIYSRRRLTLSVREFLEGLETLKHCLPKRIYYPVREFLEGLETIRDIHVQLYRLSGARVPRRA